jgi:predicted transcriptional regulator of viral defense system
VTRRQAENVAGLAPATFARLASDGSILERVAHGVYHLTGAPLPDHLDLRAAWLQLAPEVPAWERRPDQGVISHRSAAALYGIGHLPADTHDFTLPARQQTRLEVFDPDTERITELDVATYGARSLRTVTPIGPDQVLLAGGYDDRITPTEAAMAVQIPRSG